MNGTDTLRRCRVALAALCCAAMALVLASSLAVGKAYAAFGNEQFTEDGITYDIYSTTSVVDGVRLNIVHVVGLEYDGTDAVAIEDGILNIPATVTHEGTTYDVGSVDTKSLANCTELEDLRIGDLGEGCLYANALTGCTNLKTIHFFGRAWINGSQFGASTSTLSGVGTVAIILHDLAMNESTLSAVPSNSVIYSAVQFQAGESTATVYVRGTSRDSSSTSTAGVTPSTFSALEEGDVFTDDSSASPVCPSASIALPEGCDAWSFSHQWYSETATTVQAPDEAVAGCGTATACNATNLSCAVAYVPSSTLRVTGHAVDPKAYAVDALGQKVDAGKLSASYYKWESTTESASDASQIVSEGTPIAASEVVEAGTYAVVLSGADGSGLTGSCAVKFSLAVGTVALNRITGADNIEAAQNMASSFTSLITSVDSSNGINTDTSGNYGGSAYTPTKSMSKRYKILVNPSDYGACLVADSLAGVLNCTVLATNANAISASVKVNLAAASGAAVIVVGSTASISNDVKSAAADITGGVSARVSGTTASELADAAYAFIQKCIAGDVPSIDLSGVETARYGTKALILPEAASAAAFSAAAWANANKAPVFFMGSDGTLSEAAVQALVAGGVESVVAAGATEDQEAQLAAQLSTQLPEAKMDSWKAAGTEEETSAAYASAAVAEGEQAAESADAEQAALTDAVVVFSASADYGTLSAAAAVCGASGASLVYTGSTFDLSSRYSTLQYGYIAATYNEVPAAVAEDQLKLWEQPSFDNLHYATITAADATTTGSAVSPAVTVKAYDGTLLTKGTDYTLTFRNNATGAVVKATAITLPGTYTVTATGTRAATSTRGAATGSTTAYTGTYYNTRSTTFTVKQGTAPTPAATPAAQKLAKPAKAKIKTA